jgi:hypothetical protein
MERWMMTLKEISILSSVWSRLLPLPHLQMEETFASPVMIQLDLPLTKRRSSAIQIRIILLRMAIPPAITAITLTFLTQTPLLIE